MNRIRCECCHTDPKTLSYVLVFLGTCEPKILASHQDLAFDVVFLGEINAVRCVRLITLELD